MSKAVQALAICSFLTTLILLFMTSSTDLILKPNIDRIYKATLLISDVDSELWRNYKLGLDTAAKEYNVDMAVKTLFDLREDDQQQMDQILTEIEFGAEGLILSTSYFSKMVSLIEEENFDNSIVFTKVNRSFCDKLEEKCSYICYNYYNAGRLLGEFLLETHQERQTIFIVAEREVNENYEFFVNALQETHNVNILPNATQETEGSGQVKMLLDHDDIVVGLDENSLLHFRDIDGVVLYGLGYTNTLIDCVVQGDVAGFVCFNEYMAGYLSVQNLVTMLDGGTIQECVEIPYKLITKETMFENETFLFPIY